MHQQPHSQTATAATPPPKRTHRTPSERTDFYRALRNEWKQAQQWSESHPELVAMFEEIQRLGIPCSFTSICFIMHQMAAHGIVGTPYVDTKTFDGWKESGFMVKKGEKSILKGIVWITSGGAE